MYPHSSHQLRKERVTITMADLNWKYKIIPKLFKQSRSKLTHEYCKQKLQIFLMNSKIVQLLVL